MAIHRAGTLPPPPNDNTVAILCHGELEFVPELKKRLESYRYLIGVDGGLNHCKKLDLKPKWIIGDFDSVSPDVLKEYVKTTESIQLPRDKDLTDLEAAVIKAKEISSYVQMVIWGGLGGRVDHTLGNLLLLFRYPTQLFLESEQQTAFAVSASNETVEIVHPKHQTLILFPLNGPAKGILLNGKQIEQVDKHTPLLLSFDQRASLRIGSGALLVILDTRRLTIPELRGSSTPSLTPFHYDLKDPLASILWILREQSLHFHTCRLLSSQEQIFNIQRASGTLRFACQSGQVVSLIPFYGAATGIRTQGLKWELGPQTIDTLDHQFFGVCNESQGEEFSVTVGQGELLCLINQFTDPALPTS